MAVPLPTAVYGSSTSVKFHTPKKKAVLVKSLDVVDNAPMYCAWALGELGIATDGIMRIAQRAAGPRAPPSTVSSPCNCTMPSGVTTNRAVFVAPYPL